MGSTTLTAILAHNPQTSMFTFAQLYIMKIGKLTALDHNLLVEQQKVANLKIEMALLQGDTLSVYVGYHVRAKATFGPSGTVDVYDRFGLDGVRFCIFQKGR